MSSGGFGNCCKMGKLPHLLGEFRLTAKYQADAWRRLQLVGRSGKMALIVLRHSYRMFSMRNVLAGEV